MSQQTEAILNTLRSHATTLREKFGVVHLYVFGSTARGDAGPDSDVDVLVKFDKPATLTIFMGLAFHLEELLGRKVDLVTEASLRPRPYAEKDAVRVA